MRGTHWDDLTIERRTSPPAITDAHFLDWLRDRPIFVSSVMDAEMSPARDAVRQWLLQRGAQPIMWEEITPRDQLADRAYLDGVDRSEVFVLLLGSRYGVRDGSGYSPTHKEERRAAEQGIVRLVFEPVTFVSEGRDGPLTDWVRSLYNEVAIAKYADEADLVRKLENRLRELASSQESMWIKLGTLVVPGTVTTTGSRGAITHTIQTRVRDGAVRRAIADLATGHQHHPDRLTWGLASVPIERIEVASHSVRMSEDEVSITCQQSAHGGRMGWGGTVSTINEGTMSYGPAEQAELWVQRAVFGQEILAQQSRSLVHSMTAPDGPTLPTVLATSQAREWLAEGLTRLYLVEGLLTRYGGHIDQLGVGPATASSVRISVDYRCDGVPPQPVQMRGIVALR